MRTGEHKHLRRRVTAYGRKGQLSPGRIVAAAGLTAVFASFASKENEDEIVALVSRHEIFDGFFAMTGAITLLICWKIFLRLTRLERSSDIRNSRTQRESVRKGRIKIHSAGIFPQSEPSAKDGYEPRISNSAE